MHNTIPSSEPENGGEDWQGGVALADCLQSVVSIRYAISHASPFIDIEAERNGLLKCLQYVDASTFEVACQLRDAGLHWKAIRLGCRQKKISAAKWAQDKKNSPIGKRWLDLHAEFANRFDEFLEVWKWSQTLPATPTRKPGLNMFLDMMDTKRRHDTYTRARSKTKTRTRLPVARMERNVPLRLTPTTTLIVAKLEDTCQQHVREESVDVVIADVPY